VTASVRLLGPGSGPGVPLLKGRSGALVDADWPRLFVLSKALNQMLMSGLILANAAPLVVVDSGLALGLFGSAGRLDMPR